MDITWLIITLLAIITAFLLWSDHKSRKAVPLERNHVAE